MRALGECKLLVHEHKEIMSDKKKAGHAGAVKAKSLGAAHRVNRNGII